MARLTEDGQTLLCAVWGITWAFSILFTLLGWLAYLTEQKDSPLWVPLVSTSFFVGSSLGAWAGRYLE